LSKVHFECKFDTIDNDSGIDTDMALQGTALNELGGNTLVWHVSAENNK